MLTRAPLCAFIGFVLFAGNSRAEDLPQRIELMLDAASNPAQYTVTDGATGRDQFDHPEIYPSLFYTVDRLTRGAPGNLIYSDANHGTASSTIYQLDQQTHAITAFKTAADLGLTSGFYGDNMSGLVMDTNPPAGIVVNQSWRFNAVSRNSALINTPAPLVGGGGGFISAGDILSGLSSIYATAADLGLQPGDAIAGLMLLDQSPDDNQPDGILEPGLDRVVFSLDPFSPSVNTGGGPADITPGTLLVSDFEGSFQVFKTAAELGLGPYDAIQGISLVPEPSSGVGLLGVGAVLFAARRRSAKTAWRFRKLGTVAALGVVLICLAPHAPAQQFVNFCGGAPAVAGSSGWMLSHWDFDGKFLFTFTGSAPAPGFNSGGGALNLPEQQADQVQFLPSLGTPTAIVFSHTVVVQGKTVHINGNLRLANGQSGGQAVVDVTVDGVGTARYLQYDYTTASAYVSLSPPSTQLCGGESVGATLTIFPNNDAVSQSLIGQWQINGPVEYSFTPNQGNVAFTGNPPSFTQQITVKNLQVHQGVKDFSANVTLTTPQGCPVTVPAASPAHLSLKQVNCSIGNLNFQAGQALDLPYQVVNPCDSVLTGTYSVTGGEAFYDTPKNGNFAIPPNGTLKSSVKIQNTAMHGPPVNITFTVTPNLSNPCSSTAVLQFEPPEVVAISSKFTNWQRDGLNGRYAAYIFSPNGQVGTTVGDTFVATVDWHSHAPGSVKFAIGNTNVVAPANGNTASGNLTLGTQAVGSKLTAQAISADGSQSDPSRAALDIVNRPLVNVPMFYQAMLGGVPDLKYESTEFTLSVLSFLLPKTAVKDQVPQQGKQPFNWDFAPKAKIKASGTSLVAEAETTLAKQSKAVKGAAQAAAAPQPFDMKDVVAKPARYAASVTFEYLANVFWKLQPQQPNPYNWKFDGGGAGIKGGIKANVPPKPQQFWIPIPPLGVAIPAYWQGEAGFDATGKVALQGISDPTTLNVSGTLEMKPSCGVTLGIGAAGWIGIESNVKGSFLVGFRLPTGQYGILNKLDAAFEGALRFVTKLFSFGLGKAKLTYSFLCQQNCFTFDYGFGFLPPTLEPLARDYLGPNFAVFQPPYPSGGAETLLVSNEFPYAAPALAAIGNDLLLVWLTDDPSRASGDQSKLVFSRKTAGTWSAPQSVADDGTADLGPQLAVLADGRAIVVWENASGLLNGGDYNAQLAMLEIAAATYDPNSGTWSSPVRLTTNGYVDQKPHISVTGNQAMVAWVANAANNFVGTSEAPNQLMTALFDGNNWSSPSVAAANVLSTSDLSVAYNGSAATIVFSGDRTGLYDPNNPDQSLFGLTFDGSQWSAVQTLTLPSENNVSPQVVYEPGGQLLIVWESDEGLQSAHALDLHDAVVAVPQSLPEFRLASFSDASAVIVWPMGSTGPRDLWYSYLEPGGTDWSQPQQLTFDDPVEHDLAITLDNNGTLQAAYMKDFYTTQTDSFDFDDETYTIDVPQRDHSDLYVAQHQFGTDLAVTTDGISFDPANPAIGANVTVTARIDNVGDVSVAGVPVAFYAGDPQAGGVLIGTTTVADPILGGDSGEASVTWTVPSTNTPMTVYVVVDPAVTLPETDRSNNIASDVLLAADLAIDAMSVSLPDVCSRDLVVRVINNGPLTSEATTLTLRADDPNDGAVLTTFPVDALASGAFEEFPYHISPLPDDPNGAPRVYAIVDQANTTADFDVTDNVSSAVLVPNPAAASDCNHNGIPDSCDIASGFSQDVNGNGVPDECETLYVKEDAAGTNDGSSWTNAFNRLQDALAAARTSGGTVFQVFVAAGEYVPTDPNGDRTLSFDLVDGVGVYGGFAGTETTLSQRNWAAHPTTLTGDLNGDDLPPSGGNADNSYHVVTAFNVGANTVLDGFLILGGNSNGASGYERGGGLLIENGAPTIQNCSFLGNSAVTGGGAYTANAKAVFVNCDFSGNAATSGAGVYHLAGGAQIINCSFSRNTATLNGGGFYSLLDAPALSNTVLWGNQDSSGNGQPAQLYAAGGAPAVNYCDIQGLTGSLGGVGNIGGDPGFVSVLGADGIAGTADDNLRLSVGSPCIDAGDNSAVPADRFDLNGNADRSEALPFDHDGLARRIDDPSHVDTGNGTAPLVDIGAHEFKPLAIRPVPHGAKGTIQAAPVRGLSPGSD